MPVPCGPELGCKGLSVLRSCYSKSKLGQFELSTRTWARLGLTIYLNVRDPLPLREILQGSNVRILGHSWEQVSIFLFLSLSSSIQRSDLSDRRGLQ